MIEKISRSRSWQLLLVIALIVIVPLTVDINRRIGVIHRMRHEEARLKQEIAEAWKENDQLKAQLASVTEPSFLERWARVDARMTKPNEVAIIPVHVERPQSELPAHQDVPPAAERSLSVAEQWHRLFFGEPAPP